MANLIRVTAGATLGALLAGAVGYSTALQRGAAEAAKEDAPAELLAVQLRKQGFRCDSPVTAERDAARTKRDEAAWVVRCANASYRMRLIPDMAAIIEPSD
jgi:S-formylglutathione hydrolase FrmB